MSFLQKFISFGTTVILARILGPANYGLFALALVVIGAFGLFKSLGIEAALIQRKDKIDEAANTALFIIPFLGIILYLLLAAVSPLIGSMMHNDELPKVIRALGFVFVLWSISRVPLSLLEKQMKFRLVSIAELSGTACFSIVAIMLARNGWGVWSLVYAYIFNAFVFIVFVWICAKWRPRLYFNWDIARQLLNFGKFIFLSSFVGFLKRNLDNLLVGKILGVVSIGLYAVAFNVANFISDYLGNRVYRVSFPAFSKLQDNKEDLIKAYLKVLRLTSMIALPVALGILASGDKFLVLAYGDKWLEAIPALKILAFAGFFNALISNNEAVLLSRGKSRKTFILNFMQVSIFFLLIVPAARYFKIEGVAWVVSFASFSGFILGTKWILNELGLRVMNVMLSLRTALVASICMFGLAKFVNFLFFNFFHGISNGVSFIIALPVLVLFFMLSVYVADNRVFKEIKGILIK